MADNNDIKEKQVILDTALNDVVKQHMIEKVGLDGWNNFTSMIGTARDKHTHTTFQADNALTDKELSDIHTFDGIGKSIIDTIADDMTKKWISIENDTENIISNKLLDLYAPKHFNLGRKWQGLYGGAVIVMGIKDGKKLDEGVVETSIQDVEYLRVYDRPEVQPSTDKIKDPESTHYGEPTHYTITPRDGSPYLVHRSRVLIFKGIPSTSTYSGESYDWWFWGISEMQHVNDMLSRFGETIANVGQIINELIVVVYKFQNLSSMLANNDDAKAKFRARLNAIDTSKSTINAVVIDSQDDFEKVTSSITGLSEILDRYMMLVSAASKYPVSKLFGKSASGLNATGEGDRDQYYDRVRSAQYNDLQEPLQILVNYINASVKNKVQEPKVVFNPLVQQTETEIITNRKTVAETDNIYMANGVLTSEEVRENRFANGYSNETIVEGEV